MVQIYYFSLFCYYYYYDEQVKPLLKAKYCPRVSSRQKKTAQSPRDLDL